jgi:hypothetical protein
MKMTIRPRSASGVRCRTAALLVALLLAWVTGAGAETFDWSGVPEIHPGVQHARTTNTVPRRMVINVVRVDTQHPAIRFRTADRDPQWGQPMPDYPSLPIRTRRQTTRNFMLEKRGEGLEMVLAANASAWRPWESPYNHLYADNLGLLVSEGVLVDDGNDRSGIVFDWNWEPRLQRSPAGTDISGIRTAVSGFNFVLRDGVPEGGSGTPEPRTGYGLSQDSRYFHIMTIDGRRTGYSDGATHLEVGQWLSYFGSWQGVNMDGGGSTTMVWWNPNRTGTNKTELLNWPSSAERGVGSSLGIYLDTRPAALGRSPAALQRTTSREDATTLVFDEVVEVLNTGGGVLDCTVTSDVPWAVVDTGSLVVKGRRPVEVNFDARGLPPGIHQGTISIRNDANPAEVQTVSVTLEVPRLPEDLPLVESFESWATGQPLTGTNGWAGSTLAAEVREEFYTGAEPPGYPLPLENRTRVARFNAGLSHGVIAAEQQNVKVDMMMQFAARGLTAPEDMATDWQTAFGINEAGLLHVWHRHYEGAGWAPRWTALGPPALATNEWVRLSVDFDYATSPHGAAFFRPRINGSMVPTAYGFRAPDDLRSPGPWYMTANSPGLGGGNGPRRLTGLDFAGPGAIDDLVIRDAAEATAIYPEWMGFAHRGAVQRDGVPLTWFDRWGLRRDPGAPVAGYDRTAKEAFLTGTDPLDPDGKFRVVRHWMSGGRFHVEIMGNDSGLTTPYIMRGTTNLADGIWEDTWLIPRAAAPATTTTWSHELLQGQRSYFYQVEAVEEAP